VSDDVLPFSAAADRNKDPILAVLRRVLPATARILEVASGTGQHAAHIADAQASWTWQPTEADPALLPAIDGRCAGRVNVLPARLFDVTVASSWPQPFDAVFSANLLHIAPWAACEGLVRAAHRALARGGVLAVYGPFIVDGTPTAPSNMAFDASLRARDPAWGLRRLADVAAQAAAAGLSLEQRFDMPANNLVLVFRAA
jgi:SAM-dependent methyltransferase